ncbi:primosomal protein N' [Dermabacteraceae bacterium CCM 9519]
MSDKTEPTAPPQPELFPGGGGALARAEKAAAQQQRADAAQGEASRAQQVRTDAGFPLAQSEPVAQVLVLGRLAHLDRLFEYAVPQKWQAAAPGCRVKVRFAGRECDGFVVSRSESAQTERRLAPLQRLVSEVPVLSPQVLAACREIAERSAGTVADVVRLAVPPRHARAEKAVLAEAAERQGESSAGDVGAAAAPPVADGVLDHYAGLRAFLSYAGQEGPPVPRAALTLQPVDGWPEVVTAAIAQLPAERGALVVAPDTRDVTRLAAALDGAGIAYATLLAADGPEKRFKTFLRVLLGHVRVVIGNRSAALAPVQNLGLLVLFDDADDLHREPRAPYPSALTTALAYSRSTGAGLLLVGYSLSQPALRLADAGYLKLLSPLPDRPRTEVQPHIELMDDYLREREGPSGHSRLPSRALAVIRKGLADGAVLVQVPLSGYLPAVACVRCGERALCPACHSTLSLPGRNRSLSCRVCGQLVERFECPFCHGDRLRALSTGSARTADELRRAFPQAKLLLSGGADGPLPDGELAAGTLVVSTPGAEPAGLRVAGSYRAAVLLDGDALLGRGSFDADVEAVRRWRNAISLVCPAARDGRVLVVANAELPPVKSLLLADSLRFARTVAKTRQELALPPYAVAAEITGEQSAVAEFVRECELPEGADVLGPVPYGEEYRAVLRVSPAQAPALLAALRATTAARSARKAKHTVRVRVDPPEVF